MKRGGGYTRGRLPRPPPQRHTNNHPMNLFLKKSGRGRAGGILHIDNHHIIYENVENLLNSNIPLEK